MKNIKYILLIIVLCLFTTNVYAAEKVEVKLSKCVDGDTAYFTLDGRDLKVRFLAIDTPESTTKVEEFGKEASSYTCNALKNASSIKLEYDDKSSKTDKYGRTLAWVYVDDELLESKLVSEGLAEVAYIYNEYAYVSDLCELEQVAYNEKKNIWSSYNWNKTYCSSYQKNKGNETSEEEGFDYMSLVYSTCLLLVAAFIYFTIKKILGIK